MSNTERTVDPRDHYAFNVATGRWPGCVSFNDMPDELDSDRFDLSEELVADGPLDAPHRVPAGGCFSAECPFVGDPYTSMLLVSREEVFA